MYTNGHGIALYIDGSRLKKEGRDFDCPHKLQRGIFGGKPCRRGEMFVEKPLLNPLD
jgi:hypothetical protein